MLRRCVRDLSSVRSVRRIPRTISSQDQMPLFLSSRNKSSKTSQPSSTQRTSPTPQEETSNSSSNISKVLVGTVVVGAAAMAAYQAGYINRQFKDRKSSADAVDENVLNTFEDQKTPAEQTVDQKPIILEPNVEIVEENSKLHTPKILESEGTVVSEVAPASEQSVNTEENEPASLAQDTHPIPDDHMVDTTVPSQDAQIVDNNEAIVEEKTTSESSNEQKDKIHSAVFIAVESDAAATASYQGAQMETSQDPLDKGTVEQRSLAEGEPEVCEQVERSEAVGKLDVASFETLSSDEEKPMEPTSGEPVDTTTSDDGKIVIDLIEAIHAAERKQAESDAQLFSEEKRKLKEKYEKELKDARARELMYAEEAAILEKELKKEKLKSAAAIKTLQEKAEQNLQEELQRKNEETGRQLEKIQELAKAELAAAIAKEKASQIEQIAEANLNIDALCMAFYARSEEARQSHSVHKLALGTLALEEALSNGLPIRVEVDSVRKSLEGIDKDSLLELALSSLPEEVLDYGTDTQLKLKQKFNSMKATLRHFSLIPAGGGGILAHAVAHLASSIKIEEDQSGDGIESIITRVENLLVNGELSAAADVLEGGLHGSEAEAVVVEWVKQARARAIAEQTLSLLHSYATSITFS